jgi:endo-1,4-beta-xylanase
MLPRLLILTPSCKLSSPCAAATCDHWLTPYRYYNDYNLEYNQAKTDRAVEIVEIIQAAGAPIDGVGFQGHLIVGSTPSRADLAAALERFTALGVEVAYTEVDIRHSSLPANDQGRAQQGDDYAAVVGSCLDVEGCIGFTVWGFSDKYSWVEGTFPGEGEACLYDADLQRKPAWTSVSSLLAASSGSGGGSEPTEAPEPTGTVNPPSSEELSATPTGLPEEEPPVSTTMVTITTTSDEPPEETGGDGSEGPAAGQWEQCGGDGWPGPFECVSPFTCTVLNDYYSQCI